MANDMPKHERCARDYYTSAERRSRQDLSSASSPAQRAYARTMVRRAQGALLLLDEGLSSASAYAYYTTGERPK